MTPEQLNQSIIEGIRDVKGKGITLIDLRKIKDAPTDFFIICQGDNSTQVTAIAGSIAERTRADLDARPSRTEGIRSAQWVLMDYFNTIVHIFYHETRDFYQLEQLWGDAKITEFADLD